MLLPADVEQLAPWVLPAEYPIGRHHGCDGSERQAVAAESCRGELMRGRVADVRQTVGRLDDLTGPVMGKFESRNELPHHVFESPVAVGRISGLAGLVILSAEDHVIVAPDVSGSTRR